MPRTRVLDLTRLYPGGLATKILLDLGFEVIKVEDITTGDYLREIFPKLFSLINAGKKSISINLKSDVGKKVFYRLVENSDILVESFRPGVTKRLGINYEKLKNVNPRIIYCSINGYGEEGPYSLLPGHDINYVSVAGHLDPQLFPKEPCVPSVQVADVGSALLCVIGVLGMFYEGKGGRVEISMSESALLFNLLNIASIAEGLEPVLTGKYPFYNIYKCKDGYVSLGAIEEKFWMNLCRALGRNDLIEKQFDKNAIEELREEFMKYKRAEIVNLLWKNDVPVAPVNKVEDLEKDPQLKHRGFKLTEFLNPIVINGRRLSKKGKAPSRGEHTKIILKELGFDDKHIEELREKGIIYF